MRQMVRVLGYTIWGYRFRNAFSILQSNWQRKLQTCRWHCFDIFHRVSAQQNCYNSPIKTWRDIRCSTDHAKSFFFVLPMQYLIKSEGLHLKKLPWSYWSPNVFPCWSMAWNAFHYQKVTGNRWTLLSNDFWWNCSRRPIRKQQLNISVISDYLSWVNSYKEKKK